MINILEEEREVMLDTKNFPLGNILDIEKR
jgi:hypothetical protein